MIYIYRCHYKINIKMWVSQCSGYINIDLNTVYYIIT